MEVSLSIPLPSPRVSFWVALAIVAISVRVHIIAQLFVWMAVAMTRGAVVADHSGGFEHFVANVTHFVIYLGVLYVMRRAFPSTSDRMKTVVALGTAVAYTGLVLGFAWLFLRSGGI